MRTWAQWLIEHRLRWLLALACVVLLPVYLVMHVGPALREGFLRGCDMWWYELRALCAWPRGGEDV